MPGKVWEQWEDDLLRELWPTRPKDVLKLLPGRTHYAIAMRVRTKRIRRSIYAEVEYDNSITAAANGQPWEPDKPCWPTDAPIGSLRKIDVLRERLANGQELWHRGDNQRAVNIIDDEE